MGLKIILLLFPFIFSGLSFSFEIPMQAEDFSLVSGWEVNDYGYFPSQPNFWSLTKIIADQSDTPASAYKDFEVPETKEYIVWVRYESCYGFGSVFKVSVEQDKEKQEAVFGRKGDSKYFPFGRGYTVQGPWQWHNTDYVYQGGRFKLKKGKARIYITKDTNERPSAKRVVDLVYITDDLNLRPGNDWAWRGKTEPPIISRFTLPVYIRVKVLEGKEPILLSCKYKWWLVGHVKGQIKDYYFSKKGVSEDIPSVEDRLEKGDETDWQEIKIKPTMSPVFIFSTGGNSRVRIEVAVKDKKNIVKRLYLEPEKPETYLFVGIGQRKFEEGILGNEKALTFEEFFNRQIRLLDNYKIKGKPAKKLFLCGAIREFPYLTFKLAKACGINAEFYQCHPEIYSKNPEWKGFNTSTGFITVQNRHLNRECYEGNFEKLEASYKKVAGELKSKLGRELPQWIKLIEESGPPPLTTLRKWDKINEGFKRYMEKNNLKGYTQIGTGSSQEARQDPVLFYHSHRFREMLFTDVCREATGLIEKTFPEGSRAHSGSINISVGEEYAIGRGEEVYDFFKRRGVTGYSTEMSWGLGGMPNYIGPQTHSYEGAIGRSLSKYYNVPMGAYLISDGNRGYTGEFVELASYPLYANGFVFLDYYDFGYPSGCSTIGYPDILKAIKKVSYTMGEVEDSLLDGEVIKSDIALGYSETTNIWDLSIEMEDKRLPGNAIYPQERQNFYYILRHLQYPVDILSEGDIIDGYIDRYKVFILIGDHIQKDAGEKLAEWVKDGGYLISVAGGGFYDEYNREIKTMKDIFGIEGAQIEKKNHFMRPKLDLLYAEPVDKIEFEEGISPIDIFAYRQSFKINGGKALGYFKNGDAGAVVNRYGKGRALIIGGLPGISYLKGTFPLLPYGRGGDNELSGYMPKKFNDNVREVIGYFLKSAEKPVICSNHLVEPILMKSKSQKETYYISLINFSGREIKNLEVKLNLGKIENVKSPFSNIRFKNNIVIIPEMERFNFLVLKGGAE
jgi:hypothetical protein